MFSRFFPLLFFFYFSRMKPLECAERQPEYCKVQLKTTVSDLQRFVELLKLSQANLLRITRLRWDDNPGRAPEWHEKHSFCTYVSSVFFGRTIFDLLNCRERRQTQLALTFTRENPVKYGITRKRQKEVKKKRDDNSQLLTLSFLRVIEIKS